ncbi:MAG: DbpA RNA binding domain-containing protein [Gemmatimonadales bacterium]
MSGFDGLQAGALGEALGRFGFRADDALLRQVVPTAARGNNLVVETAPAAVHSLPGLAGTCSRLHPGQGLQLLLLAPAAALDEWGTVLDTLIDGSGLRVLVARGPSRAARLLPAGGIDILVTSSDNALALLQRSALPLAPLRSVFLALPELWESKDPLASLMQEISKDAQRIIWTSTAGEVAELAERYAWRALVVTPAPAPVTGEARVAVTAWGERQAALGAVLEVLDPANCFVWTATSAPGLQPAVPAGVTTGTEIPAQPGLIVAWDLPAGDTLARLAAAAPVVLLAPTLTEGYIGRFVARRQSLRLPGVIEAAAGAAAGHRATLAQVMAERSLDGALLALAPLFESFEPARVAAAAYELWQERRPASPAAMPAGPAGPGGTGTTRLWVSVGKKEGVTPADFVSLLTREAGLDRARIGRVDIRELYTLVEVPAEGAEQLALRINGAMIRRRRVTARIDRGPARRAGPA